ncbi:MAG: aldehyde dehydrogenase family protein [Phycisphaerales bacterium]|nr:aldehyde dehydrogenase family protein [Phycisphaerae bacterium]NNM27038.1 aldehyde dehydrogenase family protein [Phycisphaerales bacterium]
MIDPTPRRLSHLIEGRLAPGNDDDRIEVIDRDDRLVASVPCATPAEVDDAIGVATRAQPTWATLPPEQRGRCLFALSDTLERRGPAWNETLAAGTDANPRVVGIGLENAVTRLRGFGGWCDKLGLFLGSTPSIGGPYACATRPRPAGPVAVVAPAEPAWLGLISLLAPPLCAGNAVVVLADETSAFEAAVLGATLQEATLPAGVLNIVTGVQPEDVARVIGEGDVYVLTALTPPAPRARVWRERATESGTRLHLQRITADDWTHNDARLAPETIEPFIRRRTMWHPAEV